MWRSELIRRKARRNSASKRSAVICVISEALESKIVLSGITLQIPATHDSSIYEVPAGNLSNGAGEFIVTGGASGGVGAKRGLVQFDLNSINIPAGSTIVDVVLKMNLVQSAGGSVSVGLHRVLSPWLEAGSNAPGDETGGGQAHEFDATWKWSIYDGLEWATPGGDFASESSSAVVDTPGVYEWSGDGLINDVQAWLDSPTINFGWLVKGSETNGDIKTFDSRQSNNSVLKPILEISYEEPVLPPIISGRQWNDADGDGLRLSPTTVALRLAYSQGRDFFNAYGGNEYWFRSANDNAWFFLRPNGDLTRWSGTPGSLTGTVVENLGSRVWYSPQSLLSSAGKVAESWLNGITFELVNSSGVVVDTTVSRSIDLNNDGVIQDETERGWYQFGSIPVGNYTVRQVAADGWVHAASGVATLPAEAFRLDSTLGLTFTGNAFQNFGGLGERWLRGTSAWYYITPGGSFYRWNGQTVTSSQPLAGTLLSTLSTVYFRDLSLLYAATNPVQAVAAGSVISSLNFSSYQAASFSGFAWNDVNPDGVRNPAEFSGIRSVYAPQGAPSEFANFPWYVALLPDGDEVPTSSTVYRETYYYVKDLGKVYQWSAATGSVLMTTISGKSGLSFAAVAARAFVVEPLTNGATVQLLNEFGTVIATTVTANKDLNGDGLINSDYESGYYEFSGLAPGSYSIRQLQQSGSVRSSYTDRTDLTPTQALQQEFGFKAATHDHFNFGGRSERWFLSRTNAWFYITPQGTVFEWNTNSGGNRGLVNGRQVAQLSSSSYLNLELLFEAKPTGRTVAGGQAAEINVGSMRVIDSLFASLEDQLT